MIRHNRAVVFTTVVAEYRFENEQNAEQDQFEHTLANIEDLVEAFRGYNDLADVDDISRKARDLHTMMDDAAKQAKVCARCELFSHPRSLHDAPLHPPVCRVSCPLSHHVRRNTCRALGRQPDAN